MLCLPETLVKASTQGQEHKTRWHEIAKRDVLLPLPKLKFLLVPSISLTIVYVSICFASLYSFNTTLPYAYAKMME